MMLRMATDPGPAQEAVPDNAIPRQAEPPAAPPAAPPQGPTEGPSEPQHQQTPHQVVQDIHQRTRISSFWIALGCSAVVLILLLIFILQNNRPVDVSYLGIHGNMTLGVAMLFAAVSGMLLVGLAGTARILQLRAAARRKAKE